MAGGVTGTVSGTVGPTIGGAGKSSVPLRNNYTSWGLISPYASHPMCHSGDIKDVLSGAAGVATKASGAGISSTGGLVGSVTGLLISQII